MSRISAPLVSVCMLSYNHEKWIGQAIDGVLNQKTNFYFELIISDDCSTDSTQEIINNYILKEPTLISSILNKTNLGLAINFSSALNSCKGRYIAICEGDDFWTDPNKLQIQVEILEAHPECIMTSHNCRILNESSKEIKENQKYNKDFFFNQEKYLKSWVTQPLTCTFRNIFRDYSFLMKDGIFCDVILFYELLKHGNGFFLNRSMATFRFHKDALSSGLSRWDWLRNHVIMYDHLFKYNKSDKRLQRISRNYCLSLFIHKVKGKMNSKNDFHPLLEFFRRKPDIIEIFQTVFIKIPFYFIRHGIISRF